MLVRVYNDNTYPFTQVFKGDRIHIPAKKFIEMEDDEAVMFRGTYSPILVDGANNHLPESYKMIRIVYPKDYVNDKPTDKFKCQACGKEFDTPEILDEHTFSLHLDSMSDKDEKEKRMKAAAAKKQA